MSSIVKVNRPRKQQTQKIEQESKVETVIEPELVDVVPEVKIEPVVEKLGYRQRLDVLIQANLLQIANLKSHVQEMRRLQREHENLLKDAVKKHKKKKALKDFSKPRRSSGFAAPVIVTKELYDFLVKTKATMKDPAFVPSNQEEHNNWPRIPVKNNEPVARTDVTSHIAKYIKEHNLQNKDARREIIPDAALKKVFSEAVEPSKHDPSKKVYTYLKLQTYINHHFTK